MAQFHYQVDEQMCIVQVEHVGDSFAVAVGGRPYQVQAWYTAGQLRLQIGEQTFTAIVATGAAPDEPRSTPPIVLWLAGEAWTVQQAPVQQHSPSTPHIPATDHITAPMPGQVLDLLVTVGAQVVHGAPLVILGAMKMESRLVAPHAGTVTKIGCALGETVTRGQLLVVLEPLPV